MMLFEYSSYSFLNFSPWIFENSKITHFPPGRRILKISESPLDLSLKFRNPNAVITRSTELSTKGIFNASKQQKVGI